mgnify:CR=1 FL=1
MRNAWFGPATRNRLGAVHRALGDRGRAVVGDAVDPATSLAAVEAAVEEQRPDVQSLALVPATHRSRS